MARSFASASSQYLSAAWSGITMPLTLAAWGYPLQTNAAGTSLSFGNGGSSAGRYTINYRSDGYVAATHQRDDGSGIASAVSAVSYSANQWSLVCGVFAATNVRRVYLNGGNVVSESTTVIAPTPDFVAVGALRTNALSSYFNGYVAHAAVWSAELTAAEVASLYNGGIGLDPRSVRPGALVAYWPLLDNDGDRDWWGQFNLTATNTPTYAQHPPVLMRSTPRFVVGGSTAPTISSVTVSGTRTIGETITANVTSTPADATKAYRWQKSVDDQGTGAGVITGETASTLELSYADFGAELDDGDNDTAYVRVGVIASAGGNDSVETFSPWYEVTAGGGAGRRSPFVSQCIR